MKGSWKLFAAGLIALGIGCEDGQNRAPSAPPVPDVALPETAQNNKTTGETGSQTNAAPAQMEDPKSPIASNLLQFVPHSIQGVQARQRQAVKTAPIAYAFYNGPDKKMYNVSLTGPNQSEADRRAAYHVLGIEKEEKVGSLELRGFKVEGFDAQRTYDAKKQKSEVVVLVNPFVEVKVSVQPANKPDEAVKLLDALNLTGISGLR